MHKDDKQQRRLKILFVHNTLMWYTRPLFVTLSRLCDLRLVFTYMSLGKSIYNVATDGGREPLEYRVIKRRLGWLSPSGLPLGLLKELFLKPWDVAVADMGSVEMLMCFLAGFFRRKPVILKCGEWAWRGKLEQKNPAVTAARFFVPRAGAVVAAGSKHKEYAVAIGARPERVFIMPYASNMEYRDADYKQAEALKRELGLAGKRVIICVGRLDRQKGIEYLIRGFARLKEEREDIALLIVGEGEIRGELEQLCRDLGVAGDVTFTGFVLNEALPPYFLLCDICAMPSITYGQADIWGRAVNDAMYAGKAVIATDAVGAAFDMIRDGVNGYTVPEQDADALYRAMQRILAEPGLAEKMGAASKKIVEQGFMFEHMAAGLMRAAESAVDC